MSPGAYGDPVLNLTGVLISWPKLMSLSQLPAVVLHCHIKAKKKKKNILGVSHLCDVSTTERPVLIMSRMRFHKKRLAFGSMPVVGSS